MNGIVITIGDESLMGQILDTNSRYIARMLTETGVEVVEMLSVPDRREEIYNTVDYAMGAADLIVVTGGLGPTKDDVTKKVLAEYFGMRLVENREALGWLEELLRNRSLPMNEGNRSQAWLPEGCRVPRKYRRALAENTDSVRPGRLYNLAAPLEHARPGTYKYQGVWGVLDHILASGTLLAPGSPLRVEARCAEPGAFPFLLQRDDKYLGLRPYRTYYGYQYQAEGTSDHLPLILRCRLRAGE